MTRIIFSKNILLASSAGSTFVQKWFFFLPLFSQCSDRNVNSQSQGCEKLLFKVYIENKQQVKINRNYLGSKTSLMASKRYSFFKSWYETIVAIPVSWSTAAFPYWSPKRGMATTGIAASIASMVLRIPAWEMKALTFSCSENVINWWDEIKMILDLKLNDN